jgi:hypothetical protein
MTNKGALSLLAMPGFLILSYVLDVATTTIKAFASSTFRVMEAAWWHVLVEFVFAGAVIFLVWLILTKRENKLLVGWLFFVVGLIAFFISTPFQIYLRAIMSASLAPQRSWFYYSLLSFDFYGFFAKASALIVVLGLVVLLRKPR